MKEQVEKNKVVTVEYHVTDLLGNVLDEGRYPLSYLHGRGEFFPLVEAALEGKSLGDSVEVYLSPEDAFGAYDVNLLKTESRAHFPQDVEVGIVVESRIDSEEWGKPYRVLKMGHQHVVLDGNHVLAGVALNFNATVAHIREASDAELKSNTAARLLERDKEED